MADPKEIKADLQYHDLREWLALAEKMGEVRSVKGLNWQEEIGMALGGRAARGIARRASSSKTCPARCPAAACWSTSSAATGRR